MYFPRLGSSKVRSRFLVTSSILLTLGLVGPTACSNDPEVGGDGDGGACVRNDDCGGEQSCNTVLGKCGISCSSGEDCEDGEFCSSFGFCDGQCATCGNSCDVTDECPPGQYCSFGSCQQECTPGEKDAEECGGERDCSDDGECKDNDDIIIGGGGMGGGQNGTGGGNQDCIDVDVNFEPQIPNVVLLIDQSGSMDDRDGFGTAVDEADYMSSECGDNFDWRWNVVRDVLLNSDTGVVKPLEDKVRFGMTLYSSENGNDGDTCPVLTDVDLMFGNHQAMLDAFDCDDILDDTPTRESLTATAEKLAALDVDGPKVIVLATDGLPDTCECSDWDADAGPTCSRNDSDNDIEFMGEMLDTQEYEQVRVVLEAQRIHEELGITVEVINVSTPSNTSLAAHLDDVAERGGAVSGASLDGFDPNAISTAFQTIIDGVRSCAVDLDGEIEEGKEDTGTVTLDGKKLVLDDPDGWVVNSPTQIELVGQACETIKSGDHDLDISFPCGAFVPVIPK